MTPTPETLSLEPRTRPRQSAHCSRTKPKKRLPAPPSLPSLRKVRRKRSDPQTLKKQKPSDPPKTERRRGVQRPRVSENSRFEESGETPKPRVRLHVRFSGTLLPIVMKHGSSKQMAPLCLGTLPIPPKSGNPHTPQRRTPPNPQTPHPKPRNPNLEPKFPHPKAEQGQGGEQNEGGRNPWGEVPWGEEAGGGG